MLPGRSLLSVQTGASPAASSQLAFHELANACGDIPVIGARTGPCNAPRDPRSVLKPTPRMNNLHG
eukprot:4236618-Pyramimonas_sp.AAC.1